MNIALILSGGTGTRLGSDIPKQYIEVMGTPVITYCIKSISNHDAIDAIQIVADETWQAFITECIKKSIKFKGFSKPGANRQLSILNGLEDIMKYANYDDNIFIHDAARPLLSAKQISDCLNAIKGHDGVLPVLPMKDTVYSSIDGRTITALLDRSTVFAGQAPEVFVLGKYYEANKKLVPDRILQINGSTEPAIMAGMDIAMIDGDENNFKITTKADLERFEKIVQDKMIEKQ